MWPMSFVAASVNSLLGARPSSDSHSPAMLEALEGRVFLSATPAVRHNTEIGWNGVASVVTSSVETGTRFRTFDQFGGAWCDAEKQLPDTNGSVGTGDDFMCWAAAASNALAWTGWGEVAGLTNSDQDFKYFQDHWTDDGGDMSYGWKWWFTGVNPAQNLSGWSKVDVPGGDFYPSESFSSYFHGRAEGATAQKLAMQDIDTYCRAGDGVTIGIYGSGGHALTVWGFNYDPAVARTSTSYYRGIWVSDSDDNKNTADAPTAPDTLHYYSVTYSSNRFYLNDFYGTSRVWYIGDVEALECKDGTPAPNPTPTPAPTPPPDPTPTPDDYPNAAQWDQAAPITISDAGIGTVSGGIQTNSDTDLFQLAAPSGTQAAIKVTPAAGLDVVMKVYDANHALLASRDLYGNGATESYTLSSSAGGVYFVELSSYLARSADTYALDVSLAALPTTTDDHADLPNWNAATRISLGVDGRAAAQGVVSTAADTDLFRFTTVSNGMVSIQLGVAPELDGVLKLYDARHRLVGTADLRWEGGSESVTFRARANVTYFVSVESYRHQETGAYTLNLLNAAASRSGRPGQRRNSRDMVQPTLAAGYAPRLLRTPARQVDPRAYLYEFGLL